MLYQYRYQNYTCENINFLKPVSRNKKAIGSLLCFFKYLIYLIKPPTIHTFFKKQIHSDENT